MNLNQYQNPNKQDIPKTIVQSLSEKSGIPIPQRMKIQFASIPAELVKEDNWIVWRWEKRNGKWTKPPYQVNGKPAKSNDSSTWTDSPTLVDAYNSGKWDGIGFMLNGDHVGIDWDDIRDSQTGEIQPDYFKKIRYINSYTEISPSGNGVKTLIKGRLPAGGHHNENVGVFSSGRYFCITGNVLNGCSPNISD
jgi:putative DNA primase/helicase